MTLLKVKILGHGNAAAKHKAAYLELPDMFQMAPFDPDIIDICTPNHLHFEQARHALITGRHVIAEKPVAGSLAEVDTLLELEAKTGKRVCPIAQYRYEPQLAQFVIPPVVSVLIQRSRPAAYFEGWRGDPAKSLGGCLAMQGIHAIDLLIQHLGPVKSVKAAIPGRQHHGIEDFCYASLKMEHDTSATLEISTPPSCQSLFSFNGTHLENSTALFVEQFRRVHGALTDNTPLPVTLSEARDAIEVLTAIYHSAYDGDTVTLPIADDHPAYQGWL